MTVALNPITSITQFKAALLKAYKAGRYQVSCAWKVKDSRFEGEGVLPGDYLVWNPERKELSSQRWVQH